MIFMVPDSHTPILMEQICEQFLHRLWISVILMSAWLVMTIVMQEPKVDAAALRKKVGMVFQKANPFPASIYDNIAYAPKYHWVHGRKKLDEIVETSLRKAALWDEVKDRLKKSALGLSGGQQQRLCIARAIALEPEIILMDEATSALDPISTQKTEELMIELKKNYTVIIVTHNMQQAARVADKTAFFFMGDLIEYGKTEQIFENPQREKTKAYVSGQFGWYFS